MLGFDKTLVFFVKHFSLRLQPWFELKDTEISARTPTPKSYWAAKWDPLNRHWKSTTPQDTNCSHTLGKKKKQTKNPNVEHYSTTVFFSSVQLCVPRLHCFLLLIKLTGLWGQNSALDTPPHCRQTALRELHPCLALPRYKRHEGTWTNRRQSRCHHPSDGVVSPPAIYRAAHLQCPQNPRTWVTKPQFPRMHQPCDHISLLQGVSRNTVKTWLYYSENLVFLI